MAFDPTELQPVFDLLPARPPKALVEFLSRITLPQVAPRARWTYTQPNGNVVNSDRDYKWLPRYECTVHTAKELASDQTGSAPAVNIIAGGLLGFMWYFEQGDGDMIAYDIETGLVINVDVGAEYQPGEDYLGVYYGRVWGSVFEFVEEHVARKQSYPPKAWQNTAEDDYWEPWKEDPKHVGPVNETALFHAFRAWQQDGISTLIAGGADLEHRNSLKQTPLLYVCSRVGQHAFVQELLQHKPDVNAVDTWGNTPLILAARQGDPDVVQSLLEAGADKSIADPWDRKPIDLVNRFEYHRKQLIELLS